MTPWTLFKAKYENCEKCELSETRRRVVLAKGSLPASVLFVGEAPGNSENKIGAPFVGPAGNLLHKIIERAEQNVGKQFTKCFTNIISCIPKSGESAKKSAQPPTYAIKACSPRMLEFVELCQPKLLVMIGQYSSKYAPLSQENLWELGLPQIPARCELIHPAAILRMKVDQPESAKLEIRRCVIILEEEFAKL